MKDIVTQKASELGAALQASEGRSRLITGCLGFCRRLAFWAMLAYLAALLGWFGVMRLVGEKNIFVAFCLYLPPALWLLPLPVLGALSLLLLDWKGLAAGTATTAMVLYVFLDLRHHPYNESLADQASQEALVVLTNNRGQNMGQSLKPFKDRIRPDIMAFQESGGRARAYLADPGYAEFPYAEQIGEFVLLSKWPLDPPSLFQRQVQLPSRKGARTLPIAARFVVHHPKGNLVVYNVHLPSPRDTLNYFKRGAFLYGLIGLPGTPWAEKRRINQAPWDERVAAAAELAAAAAGESLPTFLAGDFNMPSWGYIRSFFNPDFQDAHAKAGNGFGLSFPGSTHNPLSAGGPWLRIDYLFSRGRDPWSLEQCVTEPDRASQHRAVAARWTWRNAKQTP